MIADARVGVRIASADRPGPVGRGVVADDEFEIAKGLRQKTVERLGNVFLAVEDRKADRHARKIVMGHRQSTR